MKTISALPWVLVGMLSGPLASGETALFLLSGPTGIGAPNASYVVAVSDDALIQQARDFLAGTGGIPYLVPVVTIAAGASPENRNYAEPGHPPWTWHVSGITRWEEYDPRGPQIALFLPELHSPPSAVPQLLADGHTTMTLVYYPLVMELDPVRAANVVNLSTRGWVEPGERVLIGGFVVTGGQPRNVFIRALGPSLAPLGVQEPLADPKLTLFRDQEEIASNDSWLETYLGNAVVSGIHLLPPEHAWMIPGDEREAILWLSLPPGSYTVHLSSSNEATGVALIELYDLDARAAE